MTKAGIKNHDSVLSGLAHNFVLQANKNTNTQEPNDTKECSFQYLVPWKLKVNLCDHIFIMKETKAYCRTDNQIQK